MNLDPSRSPELSEVLRAVIDKALDEVFVALPGKVEVFDPATQKANIKPLLKRPVVNEDGTIDQDSLGVINDVPVMFPRTMLFGMTLPLTKGDTGLLVFCDNSIDDYVTSNGAVDLDVFDLRSHDISDAFFYPGAVPFTRPLKTDVSSSAMFGALQGAQVRASQGSVDITSGGAPTATGGFVSMATLADALWNLLYGVFSSWVPVYEADLKTKFMAAFGTGPPPTASKNLKAD